MKYIAILILFVCSLAANAQTINEVVQRDTNLYIVSTTIDTVQVNSEALSELIKQMYTDIDKLNEQIKRLQDQRTSMFIQVSEFQRLRTTVQDRERKIKTKKDKN